MADSEYDMPALRKFGPQEIRGARSVLRDCLQTEHGDRILVIHDEHTADSAECLRTVGDEDVGAVVILLQVSFAEQAAFASRARPVLSKHLRDAIDRVSRIILLQRRAPSVNPFRHDVLLYAGSNHNRRAASMPGMTLKHLAFCASDLPAIRERCALLGALLAKARQARLQTTTLQGESLELCIGLGDYKPIESTGEIQRGNWGNVPSGETFIVPNLHEAAGLVAINGSIPNLPLPHDEELILEFKEGRAVPSPNIRGSFVTALQNILFKQDFSEAYPNCTILSELGIGTNAQITEFTGIPLFDEKILGTVHLGLGRSTQFRGPTRSAVHNDFAIRRPRLTVDDVLVTQDGQFVLRPNAVFPNWRSVATRVTCDRQVYALGTETYELVNSPQGPAAHMTWISPRSSGIRRVRVCDPETSRIAALVLDVLDRAGRPLAMPDVVAQSGPHFPDQAVRSTLELLVRYRLAVTHLAP